MLGPTNQRQLDVAIGRGTGMVVVIYVAIRDEA